MTTNRTIQELADVLREQQLNTPDNWEALARTAIEFLALPLEETKLPASDDAKYLVEEMAKKPREKLFRPDLTDFQVANAIFMANRHDLDLISWQTIAKERIRWLSVKLYLTQLLVR